jgi:hypothetical protein
VRRRACKVNSCGGALPDFLWALFGSTCCRRWSGVIGTPFFILVDDVRVAMTPLVGQNFRPIQKISART